MDSYVAFVQCRNSLSNTACLGAVAGRFGRSNAGWIETRLNPSFILYHRACRNRSTEAITLPDGMGMILGTVFPKTLDTPPAKRQPTIDRPAAELMVRTKGRHLFQMYWGSYVAFLTDRLRDEHFVLRDCSGKVPCYRTTFEGVQIAFSDVNDLGSLGMSRFTINKTFLAGFIYEPEMAQRDTALNEISEVLAGECLEIRDDRPHSLTVWDPRAISRENPIEDFGEAARQVAAVTQACIDFWASKYDRVIHLLSGGLDSSVVLGCLKRSPYMPHVTCLHLDTEGADGSELEFAQLAASAANLPLEAHYAYPKNAPYDEDKFIIPRSPKPSVSHLAVSMESRARSLVSSRTKSDAIWDGQGGDHLFFQSRSMFEAIDYAFVHGLGGRFREHVRGAVKQSKASYWQVMGKSIQTGYLRGPWHPENQFRRSRMFTNADVHLDKLKSYVWQPWLSGAEDLPPGKRWQICLLAWLIHRHRPMKPMTYGNEHHPLFSQPLIELVLRIPVFTLAQGGVDRALERAAFSDCVPQRILRRENKGTIAATLMSELRTYGPFFRDLVTEGVLVREKIVELSALQPYLRQNRPVDHCVLGPFLACLAAEVWARQWETSRWRVD